MKILLILLIFGLTSGVTLANPTDLPFDKGEPIDYFEIVCDIESRIPGLSAHFVYKDGRYTEFTSVKGKQEVLLFSAKPNTVRFSNRKVSRSNRSVEWSQIDIGLKDPSRIDGDSPDLVTISIRTEFNPGHNRWTAIRTKRIDVFLSDEGYVTSARPSEAESIERCSIKK